MVRCYKQLLIKLEKKFKHLGSNGWGLGKEMMANGKGGLLANPHFPHEGNLRFWQSHLTVPGAMNVMGGSLQGMPGVINIGFNEHVAWTHTFSTARHFFVDINYVQKKGFLLLYLLNLLFTLLYIIATLYRIGPFYH